MRFNDVPQQGLNQTQLLTHNDSNNTRYPDFQDDFAPLLEPFTKRKARTTTRIGHTTSDHQAGVMKIGDFQTSKSHTLLEVITPFKKSGHITNTKSGGKNSGRNRRI